MNNGAHAARICAFFVQRKYTSRMELVDMTASVTLTPFEDLKRKLHPHLGDAQVVAVDPLAADYRDQLSALPRLDGYPQVGSVPVAVLVPVKNEQENIAACLRRLSGPVN